MRTAWLWPSQELIAEERSWGGNSPNQGMLTGDKGRSPLLVGRLRGGGGIELSLEAKDHFNRFNS